MRFLLLALVLSVGAMAKSKLLPEDKMLPISTPFNLPIAKHKVVPWDYIVELKPDYTLESHFETLGQDLSDSIWLHNHTKEKHGREVYTIRVVTRYVLNKIRRDPGVSSVSWFPDGSSIDPIEGIRWGPEHPDHPKYAGPEWGPDHPRHWLYGRTEL